ncbi:hypothetical protein MPSEU_001010400 [Mayamaea pseudoterrestris]|nr:hypothetical protein MPSEU_001010400 [Mayamaea pseudoterrestris]
MLVVKKGKAVDEFEQLSVTQKSAAASYDDNDGPHHSPIIRGSIVDSPRQQHIFTWQYSSSRYFQYVLGVSLVLVAICFNLLYSGARQVKGFSTVTARRTTNSTATPFIQINDASAMPELVKGLAVQNVLAQRTTSLTIDNGTQKVVYIVNSKAAQQISNFRQGNGLIINIHITHHAGTTMCGALGKAPNQKGAPSFACNNVKAEENASLHEYFEQHKRPWKRKETDANVKLFSSFFHMIAWEFRSPPNPSLAMTDWRNPNLVSIIVMRDPMSRLLAGDRITSIKFPNILKGNASEDEWWDFANSKSTNNFALRILAGRGCCQGENTSLVHLTRAKRLLRRFTFVLDIECLDHGIAAVAQSLGIELRARRLLENQATDMKERELAHAARPPVSERIPFPQIYDYLLRRNYLDIELYKWSKEISFVRCQNT